MFFFLRNVVRVVYLGLMTCGAFYLYQNRQVFDPVVALAQSYRTYEGFKQEEGGEFQGKVLKVIDNQTFTVRPDPKKSDAFLVRLTGISAPPVPKVPQPDKKLLSELLGTNQVVVKITYYDPTGRILGLVQKDGVNINAAMILEGGARVDKSLLNGLSRKNRYLLLKTDRIAQRKKWQAVREE